MPPLPRDPPDHHLPCVHPEAVQAERDQRLPRERPLRFGQRKLVERPPDIAVAPLPQIEIPAILQDKVVEIPVPHPALFLLYRQPVYPVLPVGCAAVIERTCPAVGLYRHALQRTELHHGFVVPAGILTVQELLSELLHLLPPGGSVYRTVNPVQACDHPRHVAVNRCHGFAPYDRSDGGRGIPTHAFQRKQRFIIAGHRSPMIL